MKITEIADLLAAFGIGTIISAIFVFIQSSKRNQLDLITKERSEWRKGIRLIIADLLDGRNRRLAISRLKAQINPYGINLTDESKDDYYMKDGHIWKLLNSFTYNEEDCEKLSRYLELLLKYDWERSKNETRYSILNFGIYFLVIGVSLVNFYGVYSGNIQSCNTAIILNILSAILIIGTTWISKCMSSLCKCIYQWILFIVMFANVALVFWSLCPKINYICTVLPIFILIVLVMTQLTCSTKKVKDDYLKKLK